MKYNKPIEMTSNVAVSLLNTLLKINLTEMQFSFLPFRPASIAYTYASKRKEQDKKKPYFSVLNV